MSEAEKAFKDGSTRAVIKGGGGINFTPTKRQGIKTYTATEIDALPMSVKIFTDGGCDPNPGKAGSGMVVYRNDTLESLWYGAYNPQGTNNTAELMALNQAFMKAQKECNDQSVAIFCDSKYAIQCIIQWAEGWQKKGWKKAGGEIKNLPLIQEMFERYQALKKANVQVLHVNGHVGVEGNELADRMSILAIQLKERSFTCYQGEMNVEQLLSLRAG
ncbi:Ribonuclease HI-related protein 2 [hydrothermal vent metagenome]|uniref:ribonuclease H n=1 Tax=hydrothermal vent metagenome TaxID=652676 RepID=A0A3B0VYZ6_9ZZZZ